MKQTIYTLFMAILLLASPLSYSASTGVHLDSVDIDLSDKESLQRGANLFMNNCLSCHAASYMRYNRMARDIGLSEEEVKENLIFGSDKIGDTMTIAMRPDDAKKWFGVTPPDLSVIARARGTDWLYTYLRTFYIDSTKPIGTNNLVFKDSAMPHIFWQQQGYMHQDENGQLINKGQKSTVDAEKSNVGNQITESEYNTLVRDLVNFMAYISEPSKIQRLAMGHWVLLYILLFTVIAYFMKKAFWEDIH